MHFVCGGFQDVGYDPTIEDSYRKKCSIPGVGDRVVDILDTGGCGEFAVLRNQWMRGKDGVILMYSVFEQIYV
eukprot:TRINITY_DN7163_c0_g1_i1.p2 TRINITY_DN7163_c0_g1~~TRINITY_DN7163_c0_g1_i1.p2  ORF type:complete len:73 (+),score=15.97 TRINITY_DN7163_c0_g1_i1:293-511(+)